LATFGVTPQGFVKMTVLDVQSAIQDDFRNTFGQQVPVNPQSLNGQYINIWAEREASVWDLLELVYNDFDPDQALGTGLDGICALTGTRRQDPKSSIVTETLTGVPGVVVAAGKIITTVGSNIPFLTDASATIASVPAWVGNTNYSSVGTRVTNAGNVYQLIGPGVSAASGGPSGTGSSILDNTAIWRFLGAGTGAVDVLAMSQNQGPLEAPSGTLTQIQTPVAGWNGAINVLDATLGSDEETDAALRIDREAQLRVPSNAAVGAIRTALLRVSGVTSVTVLENVSDVTVDTMPPHSVECVVIGGANQDIWNALVTTVGAGVDNMVGNTSGTATDSQGVTHIVAFTRPTNVPIYVTVNPIVDPGKFPVDGATQIKDLVVTYGDQFVADQDVVSYLIGAAIMNGVAAPNLPAIPGVPGVLDPGNGGAGILISTTINPTLQTTVPISARQIATFDTSRVTVNPTNGNL